MYSYSNPIVAIYRREAFPGGRVGELNKEKEMKQKHWLLVVLVVLMAIVLTGCFRPASTEPSSATATTAGGFPVPGTETMDIFESIATQTAMAGGGAVQPTMPVVAAPTEGTGGVEPVAPTQAPAVVEPTKPPVVVVVPAATPGIPSTYTLQKGEFLYCIARRFDLNPVELMNLNGLTVNTVVQPGTTLRIPQTGNGFPDGAALKSHPTTYTVRSGDSIFSVACQYGDVDPYMIALANDLSEPYTLNAGTTINIP
jgi:LysM repeat protein